MKSLFLLLTLTYTTIAVQAQTHGVWRTANGNTLYHHFVRNGGGAAVYINQISTNTTHPILRLSSGSANANQSVKFTVENNGFLGLGANNPFQKLSVIDGQLFIGNTTTNKFESGRLRFSEYTNSFQGAFIHYNGDANVFNIGVHNEPNTDINDDINAISVKRSNGYVGIGTLDPYGDLELHGETQRMIFSTTTSNQENTARIEFREHLNDIANFQSAHFAIQYDGLNDGLRFKGLKDSNNPDHDIMIIRRNGRVGIGTITPDAKLTVKGDIHAQEIKLDLNGAVAPDFVFEPEYNLRTLAVTEAYIKENKHLPEIPSAAEMEKNGIQLKEMNLKLLQKIEELTLYTIAQQKLLDTQTGQLEKQKQSFETQLAKQQKLIEMQQEQFQVLQQQINELKPQKK